MRTHSSQLFCRDAFYLCYLGLSSLTEEVGRKNRHKENKANEKEEGREREERGGESEKERERKRERGELEGETGRGREREENESWKGKPVECHCLLC